MQIHTPITLESVPVLSWQAPASPTVVRTRRWYIVAAVVVLLLTAYSIYTGAWSFAVVCVLCGGMYALVHGHTPPVLTIALYDNGILFKEKFTRWDELAGFWILQTPDYNELHFVSRFRRGDLVIQTGTQDIAQLRMILVQRLPEWTHRRERILDTLIRICKL